MMVEGPHWLQARGIDKFVRVRPRARMFKCIPICKYLDILPSKYNVQHAIR